MSDTFCILPFTHLSTRPNGDITPCCRSRDTLGNIKEMSLEEAWNGEKQQELRRQLLNGEQAPKCYQCWEMEEQGSVSLRQSMNKFRNHMVPDNLSTFMPFKVPVLELKLSNLCNFRCRTCKPDLSTTWMKDWNLVKSEYESHGITNTTTRETNFDNDQFVEDIVRLAPTIEIVEFAGGEPLMDPLHYKILDALKSFGSKISVKYSTNLSKLKFGKFDTIDTWSNFQGVDLSLSIDGHPKLNNYIRTESDTDLLAKNLKEVRNALGKKYSGRAALCYSAWNVFGLPESYDYFQNVLDTDVHGNIAWDPIFINPQILPPELKEKANKKYKEYLNTIPDTNRRNGRIHRFVKTNMNFLNAKDQSQHFEQFLRYSRKLDESRSTNLIDVVPEYKDYV